MYNTHVGQVNEKKGRNVVMEPIKIAKNNGLSVERNVIDSRLGLNSILSLILKKTDLRSKLCKEKSNYEIFWFRIKYTLYSFIHLLKS